MLNKSHAVNRYKANSGNKKNVWCILTLMLGPLSLGIDTRYNFVTIFLNNLYLFGSIFSIIVWTKRLHDFDEGICLPDNGGYEIFFTKIFFTMIITKIAKRKQFSLGNSMLNHAGHFTLTSWVFFKFLPVVVIIEIRKSWKY